VMYIHGMEVAAEAGAEVLVHKVLPYFDRSYRHFCSHRQAPSTGRPGSPAVVRKGNAIYFAHPIFTQYNQNAPRWVKTLFLNALKLLLPDPLVRHDGPSTVFATLNRQTAEGRYVLHALHYVPERRSHDIDIIEDVIPLYGVAFTVRMPGSVAAVRLAPQGDALDFSQGDGFVRFTLPEIRGHQMVELSMGDGGAAGSVR
jgi:hypothetical protein